MAGNDAWNAAVAERKQTLKGLLLSGDPETLAPFVAEGLTAADLRRRYAEKAKQYAALEAEYRQVVGQAPNLGQIPPGHPTPRPVKPSRIEGSESLNDMVEDFLAP